MTLHPKPWLSVILPVHNGEKWVGAALDSLAGQLDREAEIVVVDTSDGPGTRAIVERYADRLNLRFVDPEGAQGCMSKTNRGVEAARADHVSWLCQDDLWLPNRAAAVRSWIAVDPQAALHIAPSVIVDSEGSRLGLWRCPAEGDGRLLAPDELLPLLLVQNFIAAVTPIVRRDAWIAVGGLDPALWYTADWDLWLKLARNGPVRLHAEPSAAFRVHGEAATVQGSRGRADFVGQQDIVVERHSGALPPSSRRAVQAQARASARINADLAAAAGGRPSALLDAGWEALRLGPLGLAQYLHRSRVIDRTLPRVRARLAGRL